MGKAPGDPRAFRITEVRWRPHQSKSGGMEGISVVSITSVPGLCFSSLCSACEHASEEFMAFSLSFVAQLPGGHKKAKRFLCEVILATLSLIILDLWVSRATTTGMSLAPDRVP